MGASSVRGEVEVWGRDGMRKLWSAANVKVGGGGVSKVEFLTELSQLVGEYGRACTSTSTSRNGRPTRGRTRASCAGVRSTP